MIDKIYAGTQKLVGKKIIHTAPHHDDILLGYFPYLMNNLTGNEHHVIYMTSGAHGVSDQFLSQHQAMSLQQLNQLDHAAKDLLKGQIRKSEADAKWRMIEQQYPDSNVSVNHLDCQFYTGGSSELDITRLFDYFVATRPDIITVLVDHLDCGPATHHTAAEIIFAAIGRYKNYLVQAGLNDDCMVIGYRNIWSSFSVDQASMIFPVQQAQLELVEAIFLQCFGSQHTQLMLSDDCDPYNLHDGVKNFAQHATALMRQQGVMVGLPAAIFLQKIDVADS